MEEEVRGHGPGRAEMVEVARAGEQEARERIDHWREEYNELRPQLVVASSVLENLTPQQFATNLELEEALVK